MNALDPPTDPPPQRAPLSPAVVTSSFRRGAPCPVSTQYRRPAKALKHQPWLTAPVAAHELLKARLRSLAPSRSAGALLGTCMEDTGGKSARRPGRPLQVEAFGPGNAASVQRRLAGVQIRRRRRCCWGVRAMPHTEAHLLGEPDRATRPAKRVSCQVLRTETVSLSLSRTKPLGKSLARPSSFFFLLPLILQLRRGQRLCRSLTRKPRGNGSWPLTIQESRSLQDGCLGAAPGSSELPRRQTQT